MNVCDRVCLLHDELELDIIGFKLMSKRSSENEQCSGNLKEGWMDGYSRICLRGKNYTSTIRS